MPRSRPSIRFFYPAGRVSLADRSRLKRFIGGIFKKEKRVLNELSYIFCSDEYLLNINRQFLSHNYYTDILTFDLSDDVSEKCGGIQGEIYISLDRVAENARNLGFSFKNELHRVIFHGALHLCGFRDKTDKDQTEMRRMEDKYLELYFK